MRRLTQITAVILTAVLLGMIAAGHAGFVSEASENAGEQEKPESEMTEEEKAEDIKKATEYYNKNAKPGSLAAKANMVKQYNEKN